MPRTLPAAEEGRVARAATQGGCATAQHEAPAAGAERESQRGLAFGEDHVRKDANVHREQVVQL